MTMNYETKTGDYLDALDYFMNKGGQFFPSSLKGGANTILCGRNCVTFWEEDSNLRAKVRDACREYGFPPENMTAGRLAKAFLRDIAGLDVSQTSYGDRAFKMAKRGSHWHYQHVETGYHRFLIEFDLKSAYFTSLFHGKSLLWDESKGWLDDGGALEVLRLLSPRIPKWLRLVILGVIASHKQQFYTIEQREDGERFLQLKTMSKVSYGAAFNAAHKAVNRTYQCMKKIHEIGGEDIKRIHTDSFALSVSCSGEVERNILEFLEKNEYAYTVKGYGSSHFLNLNEGIIGGKLIGVKTSVFDQLRAENIKIPKAGLTQEEHFRWEVYLEPELEPEVENKEPELTAEPYVQQRIALGYGY